MSRSKDCNKVLKAKIKSKNADHTVMLFSLVQESTSMKVFVDNHYIFSVGYFFGKDYELISTYICFGSQMGQSGV